MSAYIPLEDLAGPPSLSLHTLSTRFRRIRRRTKIFLLLGIVVFVTTFLLYHRTLWRDLGYLLRPIWDTPPKPFTVIPHYDHPNVSTSDLCALHGWERRDTHVRVWDATIFSVELDLLEIRLRELYNVVDHFIIIESETTFTGRPKPLLFAQHRHEPRFSWASDKILYKSLVLPSEIPGISHADVTWRNEGRSRREINDVLRTYGARAGDLLIQADVDEIPSARAIELTKSCKGYPDVLHLQLRSYMYSFTREVPNTAGSGSWRASVKTWNPDGDGYRGYEHGRQSDVILSDSGWHCSWCFRFLVDFQFKMTGYSHFDRVTQPEKQLSLGEIQRKVCDGKDVFDMFPVSQTVFRRTSCVDNRPPRSRKRTPSETWSSSWVRTLW